MGEELLFAAMGEEQEGGAEQFKVILKGSLVRVDGFGPLLQLKSGVYYVQ